MIEIGSLCVEVSPVTAESGPANQPALQTIRHLISRLTTVLRTTMLATCDTEVL